MEDDVELKTDLITLSTLTHVYHSDQAKPYIVDKSNLYNSMIQIFVLLIVVIVDGAISG